MGAVGAVGAKVRSVMQAMGKELSEKEFAKAMAKIDTDGSGEVPVLSFQHDQNPKQ